MSAALLFHVWDDELASEEGAADVHAVEQVPVPDLHVLDGSGYEDGGVVDQYVYAAPSLDGLLVHGGEVVFLGDVAADTDGLATLFGDSVHGGLDAAGYSEVAFVFGTGGDDDLGSFARKHDRHVPANSSTRTGDYGYFAIKFSHNRSPVVSFLAIGLLTTQTLVLFHESPDSILCFHARPTFHLHGVYRPARERVSDVELFSVPVEIEI